MKSLFAGLGVIAFILVIAAVGVVIYVSKEGSKLDASALSYVNDNVPIVVSGWSAQNLIDRASPELLATATPDQFRQLFGKFSVLGTLRKYQGASGQARVNYNSRSGATVTATYSARAEFQNGNAEINVALIRRGPQWQFVGFHVNSPLFLK